MSAPTDPGAVPSSDHNGGEGTVLWDLYAERFARYPGQPWTEIYRELNAERNQYRRDH